MAIMPTLPYNKESLSTHTHTLKEYFISVIFNVLMFNFGNDKYFFFFGCRYVEEHEWG